MARDPAPAVRGDRRPVPEFQRRTWSSAPSSRTPTCTSTRAMASSPPRLSFRSAMLPRRAAAPADDVPRACRRGRARPGRPRARHRRDHGSHRHHHTAIPAHGSASVGRPRCRGDVVRRDLRSRAAFRRRLRRDRRATRRRPPHDHGEVLVRRARLATRARAQCRRACAPTSASTSSCSRRCRSSTSPGRASASTRSRRAYASSTVTSSPFPPPANRVPYSSPTHTPTGCSPTSNWPPRSSIRRRPVVILQALGTADEQIVATTWADLDRTVDADHLTSLYIPTLAEPVGAGYVRFHQLARTLREECPWDREQSHASLVPVPDRGDLRGGRRDRRAGSARRVG